MANRKTTRNTHIGEWSINEQLFHSKYQINPANNCWEWQGARTKAAPLFGVNKNNKQQMTQATRVSWMLHTKKPIGQKSIYHTCTNKNCVNPLHLIEGPMGTAGQSTRGGYNHPLQNIRKTHRNTPNQWLLVFNLDPEKNPLNTAFKEAMSQEIRAQDIARHGINFDLEYSWITVSKERAIQIIIKYPRYQQFMRQV